MTKLEKLINEFCPDGVEYVKIGEICKILRGKRLTKSQLSDFGKYPVLHGGLSPMGYYNEYNRKAGTTIVVNTGNAGSVYWSDKEFWSSDACFSLYPEKILLDRFLFFWVSKNESVLKSKIRYGAMPTIDSNAVALLKIPVPPVEVQREIVRILDNFIDYMNCLKKELELRKKQYKYYSQKLLIDNNITTFRLSDLCEIKKGKTPIQKAISGDYPLVVTTTERKKCNNYQFDCSAVCIPLVSSRGHGIASLNHVYYQEGKFALGNILCAVISKDNSVIIAKYLYYYLELQKDYVLVPLMKGGANVSLHMQDIADVKIPVPPIEEQERIVKILDRFDTLCNDLTNGIPAEISARQKQYEYYRNKLLTFKEV